MQRTFILSMLVRFSCDFFPSNKAAHKRRNHPFSLLVKLVCKSKNPSYCCRALLMTGLRKSLLIAYLFFFKTLSLHHLLTYTRKYLENRNRFFYCLSSPLRHYTKSRSEVLKFKWENLNQNKLIADILVWANTKEENVLGFLHRRNFKSKKRVYVNHPGNTLRSWKGERFEEERKLVSSSWGLKTILP